MAVDRRVSLVLVIIGVVVAMVVLLVFLSNPGTSVVRVRVATTTSLYATGLLDYLANCFEKRYPGVRIEFIAVGSGAALETARRGDACAVLVHAPGLEKKYIEMGVLEGHRIFAYNYFAVVGPKDDPAGVRSSSSAVEAFRRIYGAGEEGRAVFLSRGDNSGTHRRELLLWRLAGLDPHGRPWYRESGAGMGQTLVMASEMRAYTLSDTGTYLKYRVEGRIPGLQVLYTNSSELINIYSAYMVKTCTGPEKKYAELFIDFIYTGQDLIARYGSDRLGKPLFYPAKDRLKELEALWREMAEGQLPRGGVS